ncbi:MAG: hypothetical protein QOF64_659, partial [Candidatus Binatota bacterium]|nr:hypothetical protein [Candidatus Binatota bacterium]
MKLRTLGYRVVALSFISLLALTAAKPLHAQS